MKAKILFVSDLHKRDVDFSTIKGYTQAVDKIQEDILEFIRAQEITHLISLGDWYDKGYRNIGRTKNDDNYDREIAASVNGNAYINLGNHMYIERDQNPELYMIQPNQKFKPLHPIHAKEPIFKAVDELIIGTVQISFFHFDKMNKMYINKRKPGITYHIGVYHDESVVPSNVRQAAGFGGHTSSQYLDAVLRDIDLAIVGHIHTKIGVEKVMLYDGRSVPMIIPGAMAIVQNRDILKYKSVNLPVVTISDDNTVSCKLFPFSTHMEMLKFYNTKREVTPSEGLPVSRQQADVKLVMETSVTLREYMIRRGYSDNYISVLDNANAGTLDLLTTIKLLGGM